MEPGRIENAAVSGCCFGMQDHLYGSGLLLKPASEGEKLASLRQSPLPVPTQKSEAARWLASRQSQPDTAAFSILFSFSPLHPNPAKLHVLNGRRVCGDCGTRNQKAHTGTERSW